jgi:hypothetical protein
MARRLINKTLKLSGIIDHTLTESTVILSSIKSFDDERRFHSEIYWIQCLATRLTGFH